MKANNGDIWQCIETTMAAVDEKSRRVVIEKNEMVEFRFWSPACVRTIDGLYLRIDEKTFYRNFEFVGRIFNEVYQRNQNTTKQILDCELYHVAKNLQRAEQ